MLWITLCSLKSSERDSLEFERIPPFPIISSEYSRRKLRSELNYIRQPESSLSLSETSTLTTSLSLWDTFWVDFYSERFQGDTRRSSLVELTTRPSTFSRRWSNFWRLVTRRNPLSLGQNARNRVVVMLIPRFAGVKFHSNSSDLSFARRANSQFHVVSREYLSPRSKHEADLFRSSRERTHLDWLKHTHTHTHSIARS